MAGNVGRVADNTIEKVYARYVFSQNIMSDKVNYRIIYQRIIQMTNIQRDFIKEINFYSTSPKNLDFYENYFGCNVHFNRDKLKIVIDREVYNIPLRKDPVLFEILKKQADLMLNLYPINKDFIDLVNYATLKAINNTILKP